MTANVLDGKAIAADVRAELKTLIDGLPADAPRPGLAVVLVGEDPASQIYVRNKIRACEQVGITSFAHRLSAETAEDDLIALVQQLNDDPAVNGILVQLPLPGHINEARVTEAILPSKDVDGFLPENIGNLLLRKPTLRPCTPFGVIRMLETTGLDLTGLDAVVIGQSNIVGRPMAAELLIKRCTVTICHSKTKDLAAKVRAADLVVAAVGVAELVKSDWIKPGAIVIDVGMNRRDDGSLVGDVDYDGAKENAAWITPVPGGVGPMTIAMLLNNTWQAYRAQQGL